MSALVVTTTARGSSRIQVWDPSTPLPIGHPFEWVAEKVPGGVRLRNISVRNLRAGVQTFPIREISQEALEKGESCDLGSGIVIQIRPVKTLPPVYSSHSGESLAIYPCIGDWALDSIPVAQSFTGKVKGAPGFTLNKGSADFQLSSLSDELLLHKGGQSKSIRSGEGCKIPAGELGNYYVSLGTYSWRFGFAETPALPEARKKQRDEEAQWFLHSLKFSMLALGALAVTSWLWPKSQPTQDLVPPQFAKIVLATPQKASPRVAETDSTAPAVATAPKKVQEAAVVQAFRAKALSNAVSGLLKGGMTRLLSQSDFVVGEQASRNARKIFDTKSQSLQATGLETGLSNDKHIRIASIGGETRPGNIGYGKGERAKVKGQGGKFVPFVSGDLNGSSVDEGLTKDEVGEVIHRHLSEVRYCYESAMIRTPNIEGKLMTGFVISSTGIVKSSEIKSSTLPDPRLDDCILRRLVTWQFPKPRGGVDVAVSYPFIFKTLGR